MQGIEIKVARILAGLKQYEVAARLGISQNQLSQIELGRREPSPELLERILQVIKGDGNASGATTRSNWRAGGISDKGFGGAQEAGSARSE